MRIFSKLIWVLLLIAPSVFALDLPPLFLKNHISTLDNIEYSHINIHADRCEVHLYQYDGLDTAFLNAKIPNISKADANNIVMLHEIGHCVESYYLAGKNIAQTRTVLTKKVGWFSHDEILLEDLLSEHYADMYALMMVSQKYSEERYDMYIDYLLALRRQKGNAADHNTLGMLHALRYEYQTLRQVKKNVRPEWIYDHVLPFVKEVLIQESWRANS